MADNTSLILISWENGSLTMLGDHWLAGRVEGQPVSLLSPLLLCFLADKREKHCTAVYSSCRQLDHKHSP